MFRRTLQSSAPVITLLSSSTTHSINAATKLCSFSPTMSATTAELAHRNTCDDELDQTLLPSSSSSSSSVGISSFWGRHKKDSTVVWNSIAVRCNVSGSVLHFLSRGTDAQPQNRQRLQVISITDYDLTNSNGGEVNVDAAVSSARKVIADQIMKNRQSSTTTSRVMSRIKSAVMVASADRHHNESVSDILSGNNLPILQLPITKTEISLTAGATTDHSLSSSSTAPPEPFLKEIVVPSFDYESYNDGSTMFTRLSSSETMKRVVPGVYQWPDAMTVIRPLPTSAEDRRLPPPSFVFYHHDIQSAVTDITTRHDDIITGRIGYGGLGDGQIMFQHPDLFGLDVRLCPKPNISPAFSEAQESLLAASIEELQNANTLLAGGGIEEPKDDERVGKGDCWVEVRANVKNPGGYFRPLSGGSGSTSASLSSVIATRSPRKQRIAKIPDLPYE